jgi:hypothetical protein
MKAPNAILGHQAGCGTARMSWWRWLLFRQYRVGFRVGREDK